MRREIPCIWSEYEVWLDYYALVACLEKNGMIGSTLSDINYKNFYLNYFSIGIGVCLLWIEILDQIVKL